MKKALFCLLMITMLALSACAPSPGAIASPTPVTQTLELTQTPVSTPSQKAIPGPLPNLTLPRDATLASLPAFATFTPLPTDFSTLPTPFPTATLSIPTLAPGTPETECFVTTSKEGIQLQKGPFISSYKLLPKMASRWDGWNTLPLVSPSKERAAPGSLRVHPTQYLESNLNIDKNCSTLSVGSFWKIDAPSLICSEPPSLKLGEMGHKRIIFSGI